MGPPLPGTDTLGRIAQWRARTSRPQGGPPQLSYPFQFLVITLWRCDLPILQLHPSYQSPCGSLYLGYNTSVRLACGWFSMAVAIQFSYNWDVVMGEESTVTYFAVWSASPGMFMLNILTQSSKTCLVN